MNLHIIGIRDITTTPPVFPMTTIAAATATTATKEREKTGYLEIILGPMWSGKTSALLKISGNIHFASHEFA